MKSSAIHHFREKLAAGEPVYGLWITLEAAAVTDIAAGLGLDWVVMDSAFGHLDWAEIMEHVRATNRSNTVALVRLSKATPELIKRAIDVGADGVLISRVETAGQLQSAVGSARQANVEARGWATPSVQSARGPEAGILLVAVIETAEGINNLSSLLRVDGVDILFFDSLLASMHLNVAEIRSQGKHAGMVAVTDQALLDSRSRGFTMLGLGSDSGIIFEGIGDAMDLVSKPASSPPEPSAHSKETRE
jgi:2-keto-3-deoxy-L-rhamnonate aldolase RhmA